MGCRVRQYGSYETGMSTTFVYHPPDIVQQLDVPFSNFQRKQFLQRTPLNFVMWKRYLIVTFYRFMPRINHPRVHMYRYQGYFG